MNWTDFAGWGRRVADWAADYHQTLRQRPVRAHVKPGEILNALPEAPPELAEEMEKISAEMAADAASQRADISSSVTSPLPGSATESSPRPLAML